MKVQTKFKKFGKKKNGGYVVIGKGLKKGDMIVQMSSSVFLDFEQKFKQKNNLQLSLEDGLASEEYFDSVDDLFLANDIKI